MTELSQEQRVARGERARQVRDGFFAEWVKERRQRLFEEWAMTPPHDAEHRESLYRVMLGLNTLEADLGNLIQAGEQAKRESERG